MLQLYATLARETLSDPQCAEAFAVTLAMIATAEYA